MGREFGKGFLEKGAIHIVGASNPGEELFAGFYAGVYYFFGGIRLLGR
jgi:hypothetical protein